MRRRLIVCGGLNRSGSTWQFNAVRKMFEAACPGIGVHACWISNYNKSHDAEIHVVKLHALSQIGDHAPDVILTSFRDLRAVAGSLVRMRWAHQDSNAICTFLQHYVENETSFRSASHYIMRYENMVAKPLVILGEIARVLGLHLSDADLVLINKQVLDLHIPEGQPSGSFDYADADTQLHPGHIGGVFDGAAVAFITPTIEVDIECRFAAWLSDHGYPAHFRT